VIGPVNFAAKLHDNFATIQDAEVTAIAVAIYLDKEYRRQQSVPDTVPTLIYTDHLNTVKRVNGPTKTPWDISPSMAARHVLRWLYDSFSDHPNLRLIHQKAHTNDKSLEARMNGEADRAAKAARKKDLSLKTPELYMDGYGLFTKETGLTHRDIAETVAAVWDAHNTPEVKRTGNIYIYQAIALFTKTPKAFSAQVQLFARSRQLATQARKRQRYLYTPHDHCLLCPKPVLETDENHIFLQCEAAQAILQEATEEAVKKVESFMDDKDINNTAVLDEHKAMARILFVISSEWAEGVNTYWRGELPLHFQYVEGLAGLYRNLAGPAITTTARIFNKHRTAAEKAKNSRAPNHTPTRPTTKARSHSSEQDFDNILSQS